MVPIASWPGISYRKGVNKFSFLSGSKRLAGNFEINSPFIDDSRGVSGILTSITRISTYLVDVRIGTTDTLRDDVTRVNIKDVVNHSPQQLTIKEKSDKVGSP